MLSSSLTLQQDYLQGLLESHSPRAIQASQYISQQNQKHSDQIASGKLLILEVPEDPHPHPFPLHNPSTRDLYGSQNGRYSKSNRQSPESRAMSKEEHVRILRHILEQKKQLGIQKQARRREQAMEAAKEQAIQRQLLEQLKLEKQIEKKRRLQERISLISQKREKRRSEIKEQNKVVQKILNENKLYQKLEKNYQRQEAMGLEERKRKRLEEIKEMFKPVTKEELVEHERRINEFKERIPKKQRGEENLRASSLVEVYKSEFYKKAIQESREKGKQVEKEKELRLHHAMISKEKIKEYQRHIRENFKPQTDERLVKELQNQNTVDIRKALGVEDLKQIGQNYLKHNIANRREKPSSQPVHTNADSFLKSKDHNSQNPENRNFPKAAHTEGLRANQQSKEIFEQEELSLIKQSMVALSKGRSMSIRRRRSQSQIQEQIKLIRRKEQDLNDIMDEAELDKLYEKILNVKMSMERKN